MTRRRVPIALTLAIALAAGAATAQAPQGMWHHFQPDGKTLAHPRQQLIVLPISSSVRAGYQLCVDYVTNKLDQEGRVFVTVELYRRPEPAPSEAEPEAERIERVKFKGDVADSRHPNYARQFTGCSRRKCYPGTSRPCDLQFKSELLAGDELYYRLRFKRFQPLEEDETASVLVRATP